MRHGKKGGREGQYEIGRKTCWDKVKVRLKGKRINKGIISVLDRGIHKRRRDYKGVMQREG